MTPCQKKKQRAKRRADDRRPLAEVLAEKAKELATTDPTMAAWLARLVAGDEAERKGVKGEVT